jgi:hypothetical protein
MSATDSLIEPAVCSIVLQHGQKLLALIQRVIAGLEDQ